MENATKKNSDLVNLNSERVNLSLIMFNQFSTASREFNYTMWAEFLAEALPKEYVYSKVIYVIAMVCIFTISLVGNLLTCVIIYYDKSMHTATNYYLFNLAVSDLIVTFCILLAVQEKLSDAYISGQLACQIYFVCVVCSWNNSILTITALSIERYMAIMRPLLLKSTPVWRRVTKIIVVLWLIAILETVPEIFTVSAITTRQSTICFTIPTALSRVVNGVLAIITFLIPLLIMTFVYTMIAVKVNVTPKDYSRDQIFNYRNPRSKVNKLLVAMTLSFLICWLPFFAIRVMVAALDVQQLRASAEWWGLGYRVTDINSWFSIAINPILFSLMSTKFRKALKSFWNTKLRNKHHLKPQHNTCTQI
ncbi:5-hydroxytryptamine receptor-like isoform X2 [Cydia pomonella]|uniref:5-hydroxytryptamine receptor-like isoform X2 n=1 Tax=Cydia pomonella TaxID=82600 RepID=UPI002ADD8E5A|nr:5-hydroxytryptamine receptor-like isoform X2 [Cydia pomonella]